MTDIQSDGITVWVHRDGETLARFGKFGIDIHTTLKQQLDPRGRFSSDMFRRLFPAAERSES